MFCNLVNVDFANKVCTYRIETLKVWHRSKLIIKYSYLCIAVIKDKYLYFWLLCCISDNAFQQTVRRKCLFLQITARILKLVSTDDQVYIITLFCFFK